MHNSKHCNKYNSVIDSLMKKTEATIAHLITDKEPSHVCGEFELLYFNMQYKTNKKYILR